MREEVGYSDVPVSKIRLLKRFFSLSCVSIILFSRCAGGFFIELFINPLPGTISLFAIVVHRSACLFFGIRHSPYKKDVEHGDLNMPSCSKIIARLVVHVS